MNIENYSNTILGEKHLRFAALIRVSTEKQEQQGESLNTQTKQIVAAVSQLGGTIIKSYSGQEHATEGWERKQLDQLLSDANKRLFDAVIIADESRWSRDNVRSEEGLNILLANNIRFFVLTQEKDLHNPHDRFFLAIFASIGAFQANIQTKKSIENRIERARRGLPACGKKPFGRIYDKKTGTWSIDPEKQKIINEVARRYVAGESMAKLAEEVNINHSFLHKTLREDCGSTWQQSFELPKFRIKENTTISIPPLLEPTVIEAIKLRAEANKTYAHGHDCNKKYLLSRMVFCGVCGYAMTGQMGPHEKRYYRHQCRNGAERCSIGYRPWVPAELLERSVLDNLADFWGNPVAVEKALADAQPNKIKIEQLQERLKKIEANLEAIKKGKKRILDLITKGLITEEESEKQLVDINGREVKLNEESEGIHKQLTGILTAEQRSLLVNKTAGSKWRDILRGVTDPELMSYEQKRMLVEDVFAGKALDGSRFGVYVRPADETTKTQKYKDYRYEIRGKIKIFGTLDGDAVTNYARHCIVASLPECRFCPRRLRVAS